MGQGSSQVKGNSIVMRDPEYLARKMDEGKAVIALDGKTFVGFCYIESWEDEKYVANSGLIVRPEYRGRGIARAIKQEIFNDDFLLISNTPSVIVGQL